MTGDAVGTLYFASVRIDIAKWSTHVSRSIARIGDLGYLAHMWLVEAGINVTVDGVSHGLRPFHVEAPTGNWLRISGYTRFDAAELFTRVQQSTDKPSSPAAWSVGDWSSLCTRPISAAWSSELRPFTIRVVPTERDGRREFDPAKGAVREAREAMTLAWFRKRVGASLPPSDPGSSVVIESLDVQTARPTWFCRQDHRVAVGDSMGATGSGLQATGAEARPSASPGEPVSVGTYARRAQQPGRGPTVIRHDAPDPARAIEFPDVEIAGRLRVVDSARFPSLLLRGVGRHCGMGLGLFRLGAPLRG